ncbi:Acyl-CoA synthetase (NDP forming) [Litoreibacter ascidiaceicola]|uniref:Acyl-CoA synthetase (NDP forming) n=1 Tax=Litoreibacter ascidiaceicola TaxID=1486859 RepID=A0A1M5BZY3_9RHOB|nr:acetate--CoA ligase family protein [Litoreibacter ascidiaceicola]SHF48104.1 Acyl-CoA synthetase (NDP forming) [Litoreibacter ascidiaceicola]
MPDLSRLLNPKSLAVIGGGAWGEAVLHQAKKFGYQGSLYAVHPVKKEIAGIRAYPSVIDLPEVPDAAFIGINREATIGAVERMRKLDAGGAVCFASGYAEASGEDISGTDAQARLLKAAGDMPILGPNCYGFINALDGVAVWPDQHGCKRLESGVAVLTQSSNISINMTMQTRGLPIGYMITAGNQAQTTQAHIALALLDDPRVTAIGLHIEGFGDLTHWEALAAKAHAKSVPLVALKVGKSTHAQAATISHTASLAGGDTAAQAFLDRLGILRSPDLPSFLETLKLLHVTGPLASNQISSISCSGGEASLVADMAEHHDLSFPKLTSEQKQSLFSALGPKVALANPLDYHTYIWRDEDAMTAAWSAMAAPHIALTLVVLDYPRGDICDPSDWACATNAALRMRKATGKPVAVVATLPELMPEAIATQLMDGDVIPFAGLAEALNAVEAASSPRNTPSAEPVLKRPLAENTETLSEFDAKAALAHHGLSVPNAIQTNHSATGLDALTFPVVVKAEGMAHKSDVGGVILDCNSRAEVRDAMDSMTNATSFHVEEMCDAGAELLVGVTQDPAHGYLLTIGAGGILTELLNDTQSVLIPSTPEDIKQALTRLRMYPLLTGYRGAAPCDIDAITNAILAIQSYVIAQDGAVAEVEVNPLICGPDSAVAADALIRRTP